MKVDPVKFLKISFIIGFIADTLVALNWFLISIGYPYPNIISGYAGSGPDYQMAMYISGLFMLGWGVILLWGYFNPLERRGLLIITAVLLLISIIIEIIFYPGILKGSGFIVGVLLRSGIIIKFFSSYFYSFKKPGGN